MSKVPSWLVKRDTCVQTPHEENTEGLVCWWCTESLPHLPCIHFPTKYDSLLDRFQTVGNFCSWECAKAYGKDLKHSRAAEMVSFLGMMYRRVNKKYETVHAAPNRLALKKFGGTMTIEEFRSYQGQPAPSVYFPNDVQIHHLISHTETLSSSMCDHTVTLNKTSKLKAIEDTVANGDSLKLKRVKPLERSKSKLETSLGIKRKEK